MGETGKMEDADSLEELVNQCTSQNVTTRVPAYRTLTKKCTGKSENVVWSDYASLDDTHKTLVNIKTDLLNGAIETSYEAAGVCGCLLANVSFLSLLNKEDEVEILDVLIKVIKEAKEKKVLTRSLWSLGKSKLKKNVYLEKVQQIIETLIGILTPGDSSSVTVHEAIQVLQALLENIPDELCNEARQWLPCLFLYLSHEVSRVRVSALSTVHKAKTLLERPDYNDIKSDIVKMIIPDIKTQYCKQMNRLVVMECVDVFESWRMVVHLLGKELHSGLLLINSLLEVIEKGFKSPNPVIRIESFKCWQTLMDNFSLDINLLTNIKRLKLLLAPLKTNNARREDIAYAKLQSWWHLVCKLGKKASVNFDIVIVPLLRFCFDCGSSTGGAAVGIAGRNLIMSGAAAPPGTKFSGLHVFSAEILAQILSVGGNISGLSTYNYTTPKMEEPLLTSPSMFFRYHQLLLNCTGKAVQSLSSHERKQYLLGVFLFQSVLAHIRMLISTDTSKKESVEPVKELFNTISSLERECSPGDSQSQFVFKFFEMVMVGSLALPKSVLNSRHHHISTSNTMRDMMSGTLSYHLIRELCKPGLLHYATTREGFFTMWLALLANSNPSVGKLGFLLSVMKELDNAAPVLCPAHPNTLVRLWSSVVRQLIEHIEETQMIDQGDGSEHDWSCIYSSLLFPLTHSIDALSAADHHIYYPIMTDWTELWLKFIELTPLTPTAEPNSEVDYVAQSLVTMCAEKLTAPPDVHAATFNLMADILVVLTGNLRYSELGKTSVRLVNSPAKPRKKPNPLHNMAACIELFGIIFPKVLRMVSSQRQQAASKLCEAITHVFNGVKQKKMVDVLITQVMEPICDSIKVNPAARFNPDVERKFIAMFKSFGTLIEDHFGKKHSADQLSKVVPVFVVSLRSSNKHIKQEGVRLWRSSFSSTSFSIPTNLFDILKECKLPPASLTDLNETSEDLMSLSPKENLPTRQAGSLLKREAGCMGSPQGTTIRKSLKVESPRPGNHSLGTPTSKDKSKLKTNLEEMKDEDFVKIVSPKPKRRVLTEHQIERMTERRSDIPALYSELSQAVSQDVLPSQFASQNSFDESSVTDMLKGSPVKNSNKSDNKNIALKASAKQLKTENKSSDGSGIEKLSFRGKIPPEIQGNQFENKDDESSGDVQNLRRKSGRLSKNKQVESQSVATALNKNVRKEEKVNQKEQSKTKVKGLSSSEVKPKSVGEMAGTTEGAELTIENENNRDTNEKPCATTITIVEKLTVTQSEENCTNAEEENCSTADKDELQIKADDIKTYSSKKKKDSIARRYGDYTDEDLNEELRKTSLVLQKSLKDNKNVGSNQTIDTSELHRRKAQTPVKKTLNDVRKTLKGVGLSECHAEDTSGIDSPILSPKEIRQQRISFKEVAVSPSVIKDYKIVKQIPEVKLTDEVLLLKHMNMFHVSDTDSDEEIPNSQATVFNNSESSVSMLKSKLVKENNDRDSTSKTDGLRKVARAKRKRKLSEEESVVNIEKKVRTAEKTHQAPTEKHSSSDDSVMIIEEVSEQQLEKQMMDPRKSKENQKQGKDNEDNVGKNMRKTMKSQTELLRKNSQNSSDSQSNFENADGTSSPCTPPKVTRSGRKIVAPNKDMPEPMTPPGNSNPKRRLKTQEAIMVTYVDDDPKTQGILTTPKKNVPEKKIVQKKITDMFSKDAKIIIDEDADISEDSASLTKMEDVEFSGDDTDGYIPAEESQTSTESDTDEGDQALENGNKSEIVVEEICVSEGSSSLVQKPKESPAGKSATKSIEEAHVYGDENKNDGDDEKNKIDDNGENKTDDNEENKTDDDEENKIDGDKTDDDEENKIDDDDENKTVNDEENKTDDNDEENKTDGNDEIGLNNISITDTSENACNISIEKKSDKRDQSVDTSGRSKESITNKNKAKVSSDYVSKGDDADQSVKNVIGASFEAETNEDLQPGDDDLQKNIAEVTPVIEVAVSPVNTQEEVEKISEDESSSFECGQTVDEYLNELPKKVNCKKLIDSNVDRLRDSRDRDRKTNNEKTDTKDSENGDEHKSENKCTSPLQDSHSERTGNECEKPARERDLGENELPNSQELSVSNSEVKKKDFVEVGIDSLENISEKESEKVDLNSANMTDAESLENMDIEEMKKMVDKDPEKSVVKDLEKKSDTELGKMGSDGGLCSLKKLDKTVLESNLTVRQQEEELSPEKQSMSKLHSAVSTPERQKKKGSLKYAGSRAAMLVACAKQNIKNRGTSEGESPPKSGGDISRHRLSVSPSRRSLPGRFSPSSTPPSRKRKLGDGDGGRPWVKHEPSPGASPSTSILKKTPTDDSHKTETPSPPSKYRRVSFADPPVSERVEIPPSPKTLRGIRAQKRLDMTNASSPGKDIDYPSSSKESQETDSPVFLDCSQPLYPSLISCQDKVDQVAHLLTSPALVEGLMAVLEELGVKTVGQLSQLTEADVNKLPVRAPKIPVTLKILKKYEETELREGKKSPQSLMDEVEIQLCEIFGEVDREDKENLRPNKQDHFLESRKSGDDDSNNMETTEQRTNDVSETLPEGLDIIGLDDGITPLDASPEDMEPEFITAICKKAKENPQFLEPLADQMDTNTKEMLFSILMKKLKYQFLIDCFHQYLKSRNTTENT
ncbi:telomere-associated protein RIF1-like [Homarus americanus]|uniref:telomere-associated protein RIF1-like n=1 Tax=Homarus americanus TaxID=6706 RepID=UPI001C47ACCA|nr:telomere-associated protein RIF1-like [Homarus americanus]